MACALKLPHHRQCGGRSALGPGAEAPGAEPVPRSVSRAAAWTMRSAVQYSISAASAGVGVAEAGGKTDGEMGRGAVAFGSGERVGLAMGGDVTDRDAEGVGEGEAGEGSGRGRVGVGAGVLAARGAGVVRKPALTPRASRLTICPRGSFLSGMMPQRKES